MIEESESDDDEDDSYTWQCEGPHEVYQMVQLIAKDASAIFIKERKERLIHRIRFDMLIDKLRAMFWNHDLVDVQYDYSKFIEVYRRWRISDTGGGPENVQTVNETVRHPNMSSAK